MQNVARQYNSTVQAYKELLEARPASLRSSEETRLLNLMGRSLKGLQDALVKESNPKTLFSEAS